MVLIEWINAAMPQVHDESLEGGTHYGEIPGFQGVYANGPTLEATRTEFPCVLEEWLLFRFVNGFPIPAIDSIEWTTTKVE